MEIEGLAPIILRAGACMLRFSKTVHYLQCRPNARFKRTQAALCLPEIILISEHVLLGRHVPTRRRARDKNPDLRGLSASADCGPVDIPSRDYCPPPQSDKVTSTRQCHFSNFLQGEYRGGYFQGGYLMKPKTIRHRLSMGEINPFGGQHDELCCLFWWPAAFLWLINFFLLLLQSPEAITVPHQII